MNAKPDEEEKHLTKKSTSKKEMKAESGAADNDEFCRDLCSNQKVSISKFKGKFYVDLRNYWEERPTKKGVALSLESWEVLKKLMPEIDSKI